MQGKLTTFRESLNKESVRNGVMSLGNMASAVQSGVVHEDVSDEFWHQINLMIKSHLNKFGYASCAVGYEDMEQDLKVKVLEILPKYDTTKDFKPWFWTVMGNSIFGMRRSSFKHSKHIKNWSSFMHEENGHEHDYIKSRYSYEPTDHILIDYRDAIRDMIQNCTPQKKGWVVAIFGDPESPDFDLTTQGIKIRKMCRDVGGKDSPIDGRYGAVVKFYKEFALPFLQKRFGYNVI